MNGAASRSAGTAASRSANADAGVKAADVNVNRVFTPGRQPNGNAHDYQNQDLGFMDLPNEPGPKQPDGLQDENDDVPEVGADAELVTSKAGSSRSNDIKEKL